MKSMKLIGHIGYDAIIKNINGTEFVDFSVAVNEKYKKADGTDVESTQWFSCSTKNIKLASFLKKGDPVYVEGNFKTTVYQDKDGKWNAGINLRAFNIQLLATKKDEENEQGMAWLKKLVQNEIAATQSQKQ
jgi:single-strand DNA-binding protein